MDAVDLGSDINNHEVKFKIYPIGWESFDWSKFNLNANNFKEIKYLDATANDFDNSINNLPDDKGGIYIFFIKFNQIPNFANYLVYIGRAQKTDGQNLRKRCKEYFQKYRRNAEDRAKIIRMFKFWKKYLYLKYIELDDNKIIIQLEEELINTILPPFNDEIPDKTIKTAVKAFL